MTSIRTGAVASGQAIESLRLKSGSCVPESARSAVQRITTFHVAIPRRIAFQTAQSLRATNSTIISSLDRHRSESSRAFLNSSNCLSSSGLRLAAADWLLKDGADCLLSRRPCNADSTALLTAREASGKGVDAGLKDVGFGYSSSPGGVIRAAVSSSFRRSQRPWRVRPGQRRTTSRVSRQCIPNSRDSPPRRDTGIASEEDWNISLQNAPLNESGLNEDGSSWYRESGEDVGDNGYRCRWSIMGGRNPEGSVQWKETWWEKSDWTGYKELGAEKSGRNAVGASWWETWQEVLRTDEWSGIARIERSAHKQAKSRTDAWTEKWWEKYNERGWTEKGAYKFGRHEGQSWWEKWGEQYDGRGAVLKWTDKWAEQDDDGSKWGDKWEERFTNGVGRRQGETWHLSPSSSRWSRTWGEEHYGNGKVHKYGKSTSGEVWDVVVDEPTYYEATPHYGWAEATANSLQLLAIEQMERGET
ncbi:hypothetical protein CLOM_g13645 [Closterium sp. NIES-68]|nr:hypothetical protein CLOM_g13645 [Closterium sp. NIES-68]